MENVIPHAAPAAPQVSVGAVPEPSMEPVVDDDSLLDDTDLPPVYQFPIVRYITTTFYDAGPWEPLPLPELDD